MALNDDQQQIEDWTHGFAEDVMSTAAEWDEREEFPYPVAEAAKIGLYGWEFLMNVKKTAPVPASCG